MGGWHMREGLHCALAVAPHLGAEVAITLVESFKERIVLWLDHCLDLNLHNAPLARLSTRHLLANHVASSQISRSSNCIAQEEDDLP